LWAAVTPIILRLPRRLPLAIPAHVTALAAMVTADTVASYGLGRLAGLRPFSEYPLGELIRPFMLKAAMFDTLLYAGVLIVASLRGEQLSRARLEARLAEAQLDALKMQIHPHFLFNTLNAIAVLVRKGDNAAVKMLNGLGDLLRRSLAATRVEFVSVGEELDFLRRYVDIETTRFSDRLRVEIAAGPDVLDARIPSLILQPIVENAIKHGLAPRAEGGRIDIAVRPVGDRLAIAVRDDGIGLASVNGDGVGLSHVRARLAQLYPDRHQFTLRPGDGGGTVAELEIPLEPCAR
jgi:LytS/YehU family sensor histidine kinase